MNAGKPKTQSNVKRLRGKPKGLVSKMVGERMKTIAIIGASYLQLPIVRKAKEMGLRTICFAWPEGAVCKDVADAFYPISIVDKPEILEVCKRECIDAITTIASDVAVPTVAYVAERMGLIGNTDESALKCTNKYLMRCALKAGGVSCPRFALVRNCDEIAEVVKGFRYPLIAKPVDRSGSMGVLRVERFTELNAAVEQALKCSFGKEVVVEECIVDMREVSVEGMSWRGEYTLLQITDKVTTGQPHYVELGHHQPTELPDDIKERIVSEVQKSIAALEINYGASHSELMITKDGCVYVTEVGARMGGDFIGSDLVKLSTGYDFLEGVILCALGEFSGVRFGSHRPCSGVWFYAPETKWVGKIIREGRDSRIVSSELQKTDLVELTRSADRSGYFIYSSDTRWEAPDD